MRANWLHGLNDVAEARDASYQTKRFGFKGKNRLVSVDLFGFNQKPKQ